MSYRLRVLLVVVSIAAWMPLRAVAQPPAPAAAGGAVHGQVVDPDDALIPGATVTVTSAAGKQQTATSKSDGTYTVRGLAAGTYTVVVTAPGFAPLTKDGVRIATGANIAFDAKMTIADQTQQVTVQADTVNLSVDPENNASSTTITGDALQALSDDPDELASELSALAGPSAGPNGGQIYIDGFTGGQLPPKSSILAIRINSNPFSAQYDQLGYGRIEIITKPGTDKYHGSGSFQFQDKAFNTSTPFLGSTNDQPSYHTLFALGNLTGPIKTGMSFSIGGSYRDIQNNAIINPTAIYSSSPSSTVMCQPGDRTCTSNPYPTANRAAPNPQTRWDISPRLDMLLGQKNTLTARFEYESGFSTNNGSGNSLPSLGDIAGSDEVTVQISDTQLLTDKVINESRFEFQRDTSGSTPLNSGPQVAVQGIVSAFGTGGGSINSTTQTHYEVQNYTSIQLAKNFIRLGGRLRSTGEALSSNGGASGTILYSYLLDPCYASNGISSGTTQASLNCANTNVLCAGPTTGSPPVSSYQCGVPYEFTQTAIKNVTINARQTDFEPYAEDDWKINPNITWSYGLRLETQNYINSTHDFAPRTSIAFGIPRKSGKTTTVLRAGFGIFYNRYGLSQIANLIQNNGQNQNDLLYTYPGAACTPTNIAACQAGTTTSTAAKSQTAIAGPALRSAYVMQSALTMEQQVGKYASVSVTYLNARGEHQFLTRVFPTGSGYCGNPSVQSGYVDCSQSEGVFRQNQINTNINVRTPKGINIFGFYSANWADSNLSGITNPYVSSYDYGRAGFAVRSRLTIGGTIPLPFLITASPLIFAQSGSPYTIMTGQDNNLDGISNDRPAYVPGISATNASCLNPADYISTKTTSYTAGEPYAEIPVNSCTGPAEATVNLRLSRTFGFGPKTDAGNTRRGQNGGQGGGPGGGGFGGGPGGFGGGGGGRGGGGGGRGGGGGGGGRQGTNTGRKYNLSLGAQAFNLFNQIPYGNPVGLSPQTSSANPPSCSAAVRANSPQRMPCGASPSKPVFSSSKLA